MLYAYLDVIGSYGFSHIELTLNKYSSDHFEWADELQLLFTPPYIVIRKNLPDVRVTVRHKKFPVCVASREL